jgi:hypothetical protein
MCRSIKVLRTQQPPATRADMDAASLQFVRKVSGYRKPSKKNEPAFEQAVRRISDEVENLLAQLSQA